MRRRSVLALLASLALLSIAPCTAYEKRLNCGSTTAQVGPDEKTYEPDVAYDPSNRAGYVCDGCAAQSVQRPLSRYRNHPDPFDNTNDGTTPIEYRFDLPNGSYLVTVGFVHYCYYWAEDPCHNVFDVVAEGVTVLPALDIEQEAQGHWKVLEYRIPVTVYDGQLNLVFSPLVGHATVATIEVVTRPVIAGPPAPPQGVRAQDGYGRIDVLWTPNTERDLAGYHVYRALDANGPWERVDTRRENLQMVFNDVTAPEGGSFAYRVTAVDVDGNESAPSEIATATSHAPEETTLPLMRLYMQPDQLAALNQSYWTDNEFDARFDYPGIGEVDAKARYRGNIARWFSKRGWKIKLDAVRPGWGGDTLNLNGDMWDAFMVRKCLSYDLYRERGMIALECRPAHLELNGEYYGVVHDFENADEYFLQHHGLDPLTEVFKDDGGGLMVQSDPATYRTQYLQETGTAEGYRLLQRTIEAINASQDDMANVIAENFDLPDFMKWYAGMNFLNEWDSCVHNYYLLRDPNQKLWRFVPLDHDGSWGNGPWDPYSANSGGNIGICTNQQQGVGWNKLYDNYMNNLQLRKRHCQYLREMMGTPGAPWTNTALDPKIDAALNRIMVDGVRDANKFPWEDHGPLDAAAGRLKAFVTDRWSQAQLYMNEPRNFFREPDEDYNLYVNEYMANNVSAVKDEYGEYNNWIELFNAAKHPVDAGGIYLSDDLNAPQKWAIPAGTTIPAEGFLVVWADSQPAQGPLHAPLVLKPTGGVIVISSRGGVKIQHVKYGTQNRNVSQGMLADGLFRWRKFLVSSPGASNSTGQVNQPAAIAGTHHSPAYPGPATAVTVTARITDDGPIRAATLWYQSYLSSGGVTWVSTAMLDDGLHDDGAAGDGVYGAQIPAQNQPGKEVKYYVAVNDNLNVETRDPQGAPDKAWHYYIGRGVPAIQVNELMADNSHTIADERGEYDDWVELRNLSATDVDLTGMYLSDDPALPNKWRFIDGTVLPASGRIIVWCDGDTPQGRLHTNFKLSKSGEGVYLYDTDETGRYLLDGHVFGAQTTDWSEGRWPEGSNTWVLFYNATPGAANEEPDAPPVVSGTVQTPLHPTQLDVVTVTATLTDDHQLIREELFVDRGDGAGFLAQPMFDDGAHGDGAAGDHVFGAQIAPAALGTTVRYYVEGEDHRNRVTRDPAQAPSAFYSYSIGYQPPRIVINEFLADNRRCCRDEAGDYDDWVELYNADTRDWDLSGMYLTDELANPAKWRIPDGTVLRAGEFLLVWCDEQPAQGPLHAMFKLSKSGEEVGLFDTDANGRNRIDGFAFGAQVTDRSQGRSPDGSATWAFFNAPSPGDTNSGIVPVAGIAARPYNTVVDVTWKPHPDPNLVGYDVLGANAATGPFVVLNAAPVAGTSFRDAGLPNGQPRWYKVRARFASGQRSRDAAAVSATPVAGLPTPIVDLVVTRENADVVLRWTSSTNEPALLSVDVFRDGAVLHDADVDAGLHWFASAPVAGPFIDAGEAYGTATRFYVVRPVDANGQRATE